MAASTGIPEIRRGASKDTRKRLASRILCKLSHGIGHQNEDPTTRDGMQSLAILFWHGMILSLSYLFIYLMPSK